MRNTIEPTARRFQLPPAGPGREVRRRDPTCRAGFTLVELMVAAVLAAVLLVAVSSTWQGIARSVSDSLGRARVTQEASFVIEQLRRDLGGFLRGAEDKAEDVNQMVGHLVTSDSRLLLCYDGGDVNGVADWAKPDTVIAYELRDQQLWRIDQTRKGSATVVANHVSSFTPRQLADGVQIDVTLASEDFSRTLQLIAKAP